MSQRIAAQFVSGGVSEPARSLTVRGEYDVIVAGGGLAGVSAAVASARAGARTLLLERNGFPGGVATAGMCCSVFNCYYTAGHELVVKGNSLEFVDRLAQAHGPGSHWHRHKGHIIYDVETAKMVLTDLVEEAGGDVLFEAPVVGAVMDESRLRGVVIETNSGREALLAETVVDCTGNSDVAWHSGAPVRETGGGIHGLESLVFRVGGVDVDRFVEYFVAHPEEYPPYMDVDWTFEEALAQYKDTGTFLFPHGGGELFSIIRDGIASGIYPTQVGVHDHIDALQIHAIRDLGVAHLITGFSRIEKLDVGRITRAMIDGRKMAFEVTEFFRGHVPGFEKSYVSATGDDLGIRVSRWIDGEFKFAPEMKANATRFEDSIGRGVVESDFVKNTAPGAWGVQAMEDSTFDIPYRCMLPREVDGLIMGAGRSVSAVNPWTLRVMALTMVIGQGAGVAAAVCADSGTVPREVDITEVQSILRHQGAEV